MYNFVSHLHSKFKKSANIAQEFFPKNNYGIKTQNFMLISYLLASALIQKQEKMWKVKILKFQIVIRLYFLRGIF